MSQFDKFKEKFEQEYGGQDYENSVEVFISLVDGDQNVLNAELKKDDTISNSDSYDYTDESYTKVFYFPKFDIYVEFTGWYKSYDGSGWNENYREVKPKTLNSIVYE
jgi:hypothetical protein